MEANKILTADLLDLIFDDRNKAYGAYELRVTYEKRIKKSLLITGSIAMLIITGTVWANTKKHEPKPDIVIKSVELTTIKEEIPVPPPEQKPPPQQEPVRSEIFLPPVLADDFETPPATQDQIDLAAISNVKQDGSVDAGPTEITPPGDGKDIIEAKKDDDPPSIHERVEIDAKFVGDWKRFLERNLNGNIPVDNGAPVGRHTVRIKFVVDVDGTVSNIQSLTNLGFGMEQEAVRVLKKAAKWEPAFQNGTHVKAYRIQTITFEVTGDE